MEFWNSFWPSFASSIASGILFSVVIAFIIRQIRKPKLEICLSIGTIPGNQSYALNFYCVNHGTVGLMPNEIQWHYYFESSLRPSEKGRNYVVLFIEDKCYNYINGTNNEACLPNSSVKLLDIIVERDKNFEAINGEYFMPDGLNYFYSLCTIKGVKHKTKFKNYFKKELVIEDGTYTKRKIKRIERVDI